MDKGGKGQNEGVEEMNRIKENSVMNTGPFPEGRMNGRREQALMGYSEDWGEERRNKINTNYGSVRESVGGGWK
jgi:hypothetical protein